MAGGGWAALVVSWPFSLPSDWKSWLELLVSREPVVCPRIEPRVRAASDLGGHQLYSTQTNRDGLLASCLTSGVTFKMIWLRLQPNDLPAGRIRQATTFWLDGQAVDANCVGTLRLSPCLGVHSVSAGFLGEMAGTASAIGWSPGPRIVRVR